LLKVTGLSKQFIDIDKKIAVLQDIDLSIEAGQSIALTGQSGSGKSTLLHLLGGFERADSGSIRFFDSELTTMSDRQLCCFRRRHLGMIFQQFNLIPSLNALDNITFVRRLNGLPAEDSYTRQLISLLELQARLKHYPQQLSGGEQQRVAIARAMASRPAFLMADEPTGSLDEQTADQVMKQLMQAVAEFNTSLLLVTHSAKTAGYLHYQWQLAQGKLRC
jgi:putative ABC transport system ATP-binding protein